VAVVKSDASLFAVDDDDGAGENSDDDSGDVMSSSPKTHRSAVQYYICLAVSDRQRHVLNGSEYLCVGECRLCSKTNRSSFCRAIHITSYIQ